MFAERMIFYTTKLKTVYLAICMYHPDIWSHSLQYVPCHFRAMFLAEMRPSF